MSDVIEAIGLRKRFGKARALDGLDLAVHAGDLFCLFLLVSFQRG
jgi:hypothetical protein